MTAPTKAGAMSPMALARLTAEHWWVHRGHVLCLARDIDYQRKPTLLWVAYYRPTPITPLGQSARTWARAIQHLASHPDRAEAVRLAEAAVDGGEIQVPPDPDQARAVAEWLDREAGIAGFVSPEELPHLDVVPFRYDPTRPPTEADGLQIGRDDAGTWRTYQERYPDSTLTAGHATNVEAYWAAHALRKLAPWATTVDVRADGGDDEPGRCRFARESLADRVDTIGERFAEWRKPVVPLSEATMTIKGVTGLHLARVGRGDWSVVRTVDNRSLLSGVGSQAKATTAARALAALGDLATVPVYVMAHMPALNDDIKAIRWELAGSHLDASRWAEESRARAAERRREVAEAAEAARAARRR